MPIPIKIRDNTSTVKVKPVDNIDEIKVRPEGSDVKALELKLKEETKERIEADDNLQAQIITKQDNILFITLPTATGTLDSETLNLLIASRLNKLVYDDNIYSLSTKDNRYWRYMGQTTDPNMLNTIVVDTVTGEWVYSEIGNAALQNHIADTNRHLREGEREFWNNKLNFTTDGESLEFNRN